MDTNKYINLHTHHISNGSEISIVNIILRENGKNFLPSSTPEEDKPNTFFSAGIHPWFLSGWKTQIKILEDISKLSKVIAIGECGLDKTQETPLNIQKEVFELHIDVSEKLQKPIIIHCVKAHNELIQIKKAIKPNQPWIIHGYRNNTKIAKQCIESGMYLSLGKSLFHNPTNDALVSYIPLSHLFLETDETDFTIEEVYQQYADIKEIKIDKLKSELIKNFKSCFKFWYLQEHW